MLVINSQNDLSFLLIQSSLNGILAYDRNFNITIWNPALEKTTGFQTTYTLGKNLFDLFPFLKTTDSVQLFYDTLNGQTFRIEETPYSIPSTNKAGVAEANFTPIKDETGNVIGGLVAIQDITEKITARKQLAKRERKLTSIVSNLPGFVYECLNDKNWTTVFLSDGIYHLTGYKAEEFFGDDPLYFSDLILPPYKEYVWNEIQKAVSENRAFKLEYKIKTAWNTEVWVWEQGAAVVNETANFTIEGFITDITERKQTEERLKESENKYRSLTELSGLGVWQLDKDKKTIYLNQAMLDILGLDSKSEIEGKTIQSFFTPESLEIISKEHLKRKSNVASTYEVQLIRKDKEIRTIVIHGAPLIDANGNLFSVIGTIVDITEHKLTNEALVKSEERFRRLFENTPMAKGISRNGIIIQVNNSFAKLFGYTSPSELIGTSLLNQIALPEREEIRDRMMARSRGEKVPDAYEFNGIKKDGTVFPLHADVAFLELPDGMATIVTLKDITEEKLAEMQLKKSEAKFRTLFESELMGILIADDTGKILEANNAFFNMLGYTPEDLKSGVLNWKTITPEEYYRRDLEGVRECLTTGIMRPFEKEYFKKDGKRIPVLIGGSRIQNDNKGVTFIIDISALKQSREELKATNKELNTFLYMASHDLKGPLASVIGLTQIAKTESQEPATQNYLDLIMRSTAKLDRSLMNLMKIMKIKGDNEQKEAIDLVQLIEEIKDNLKQIDGYKKVKITYSVNLSSPLFNDLGIINSVLQNLIENSIKYQSSLNAFPFVNINISEIGNNVIIEVEDNGKGIDPGIKHKVFDMFYRGTSDSKGSGLGLYIVKNAVEKIQGTIDFRARENGGTVFTVVIPKIATE
ncbi:MAG TPA: PAS domain S-box protein [Cytophagales bacterium]|nr:PAS domain S-box protein [Cytophagales bacterium]